MRRSADSAKSSGTGREFWTALLAAAGVLAGLTGFAYLIGAATLWLALRSSGYSADIGIEHQPRSQVIALGLRGALAVAAITSFFILVGAAVNQIPRVRWWARRLHAALVLFPLALVVLGASFASWRWLAVATALASLVLMALGWIRLQRDRRPWLFLIVLFGAAVTAVSWQYGGAIKTNSAFVSPSRFAPLRGIATLHGRCGPYVYWRGAKRQYVYNQPLTLRWLEHENPCHRKAIISQAKIARHLQSFCSFPYFGESAEFVYVGGIRDVRQKHNGDCEWSIGPVVELRRHKVRLRFTVTKSYLGSHRGHPINAGADALRRFYRHLVGR